MSICVRIWLDQTSQPIVFENAENTYQKGSLFCVYVIDKTGHSVYKYPVDHLFNVKEDYGEHGRIPKQPVSRSK